MNFLRNIRIYLGKRSLASEMQKLNRIKKPVNLNKASSIGIIYELSSEDNYNKVTAFTKKLQDKGKKVHVIGLYYYNRIPVFYIPKLSYDLLLPKNTDFFYRPTSQFVKQFIETPFEILIDLSSPNNFTLHYIANLSIAGFKVGKRVDDRPLPYDLMIDFSDNEEIEQLINQIEYYLATLEFIQPDQPNN